MGSCPTRQPQQVALNCPFEPAPEHDVASRGDVRRGPPARHGGEIEQPGADDGGESTRTPPAPELHAVEDGD